MPGGGRDVCRARRPRAVSQQCHGFPETPRIVASCRGPRGARVVFGAARRGAWRTPPDTPSTGC